MPAVPCPACNETVRLPDTQLPPEGTIQCPWCSETRSVEEWTPGLPPLALVFGPDGLPFVAAPNPVQQTAEDLNHSVSSNPESCKTPDDKHIEDAFAALESTELSESDWEEPLDSDLIVDLKQPDKMESGLQLAESRLLASRSFV